MLVQRNPNRARFFSFSGIDGAGKSTQIRALCEHLSDRGLRVRVIAFWDHVALLTRFREKAGHKLFKGDKGVGAPSAPIHRRDKNVRSWPMTCFRLFLYLLDGLSLRFIVRKALRSNVDCVLFDRYAYDELANLNLNNRALRVYVRLMLKLVPRPDESFVLDADSAQAHARKPEYPLEFVCINRQSYLDLSRLIGDMTIVPPMSIDHAQRIILEHALRAFTLPAGVEASPQSANPQISKQAEGSQTG